MMRFPLGLPEGSVRAILAIGILAVVAYVGIVQQNDTAVGGLVASLMLVKDYFTARGRA